MPAPHEPSDPAPAGGAKGLECASKIGSYIVERELGRGGMGVVYLAVDPKLKRHVAIKALPTKHAADPGWRDRLAKEAERLGALNHPHIALIHERLDLEDGGSFLVMEFVEGQSLRALLRRGPLPLDTSLTLGAQVTSALESAHNRGIVHRDIKPENIQVTSEYLAKVLDFGVALDAPPTGYFDPAAATRIGSIAEVGLAGTPGYMSPEQARGRPVDKRTDIFAFGCVLYECLSGRFAFDGDTDADRIAATLHDEPDWDLLPSNAPDNVRDLIAHCLEKNSTDRLRDIADARYVLESAAGRRSTPSKSKLAAPTPHNLPVRMQSFVGREEVVERLRGLVGTTRLLTIAGTAGSGKTSLAVQVAGAVLPQFQDGVWFVDLSGAENAANAAEVLAAVLGVAGVGKQRTVESFRPALENRSTLLVLDNCEHLIPGIGAITDELLRTYPLLRVLATSREVLGVPGEQVYFLSNLVLPGDTALSTDSETLQSEAVRLFIERARLVRPGFSPRGQSLASIARTCQRLDGIPLAIELAAARVKMLSPEQIEEKLSDRFHILTGGSGSAGTRHNTMRGALDWSYRFLSEEDRNALHQLEVFVGGWTLDAATCLLQLNEFIALDVLTRLVDKSLVVADMPDDQDAGVGTRYRLLESIREYLKQRRLENKAGNTLPDWVEVCHRHLTYFESFALRAVDGLTSKDADLWRRRTIIDRANLIAAQRHALGPYGSAKQWASFNAHLSQIWKKVFTPQPHREPTRE